MTADQRYPLVTFALFAYNQERYIREAVEGALAQDYPNLEIIVSDDCSTDGTFDVIEQTLSRYAGRHRIRAIRNQTNQGLIRHVLSVGKAATGDVVVVAAGDDISLPQRTSRLADSILADPRVAAVDSKVDIIDEHGSRIAESVDRPLGTSPPYLYLNGGAHETIQGCAAAYRRDLFLVDIPDGHFDFAEDILLAFHAHILGRKKVSLQEALVLYRRHGASLSNRPAQARRSFRDMELDRYRGARSQTNLIWVLQHIAVAAGKEEMLNYERISFDQHFSSLMLRWTDATFRQRLALLFSEARQGNLRCLKWTVTRLFGSNPDYEPRTLIGRVAALGRRDAIS